MGRFDFGCIAVLWWLKLSWAEQLSYIVYAKSEVYPLVHDSAGPRNSTRSTDQDAHGIHYNLVPKLREAVLMS